MIGTTNKSLIELIAIAVMTATVLVLAILQYRWTGAISRTEQERLRTALGTSVKDFDHEFSYDFQRLCESFEVDPDASPSALEVRIAHQYSNWARTSSRPGLLLGVHIWTPDGSGRSSLESLNLQSKRFQEAPWPVRLESLRQFLGRQFAQLPPAISDREANYYPWTLWEDTPALIRPLFLISSAKSQPDSGVQPIGFLVVELNGPFLSQEYLPELVERHFAASGFAVSVRAADASYQTLYASRPDLPISTSAPDAAVNLLDSVGEEAKRRGHPPLLPSSGARQWQLAVQHPAGSLEVAVASWRRRNLAISFGLLSVLAASMVLIFSVARRAERLARLQMEFVAGVSHELCTPLAVINSAAENLVDGVVDNPTQVHEYGGMIREHGRRLESMLDEVLSFAAGGQGRSRYDLRAIEIAPIVEKSLLESESMLRDARFAVEKEISADLPLVTADPDAVGRCVANLISNAMKYAGTVRSIAVRAKLAPSTQHPEVQVSVEDRGIGVSAEDLSSIFEPFYRGQAARVGQIRGVGLGLYLVKRMMEDMGGRVTASSKVGTGSLFTLHFPVSVSSPESGRADAA
jgi:signal transduction histidine kinase